MNSEISFAQNRLTGLTEQLLAETSITGDIVFFADEDEGRINGATWQFEEGDHILLKNSDFKFMLMELLDTLIQHRARQGNTGTLNGVVHLENSSADIQWLTSDKAEKRRSVD